MSPRAALLVLAACVSDGERDCTSVGCSDTAWLLVAQPADLTELANAMIEVCIDDECLRGWLPTPQPTNDERSVELTGTFQARGYVNTVDAITVWAIFRATDVHVGDIYSATILREDGTVLTRVESIVTSYREYEPNGPRCEPHCWQATLESI